MRYVCLNFILSNLGDEGGYEMGGSLVFIMVWDGDVHVLKLLRGLDVKEEF